MVVDLFGREVKGNVYKFIYSFWYENVELIICIKFCIILGCKWDYYLIL